MSLWCAQLSNCATVCVLDPRVINSESLSCFLNQDYLYYLLKEHIEFTAKGISVAAAALNPPKTSISMSCNIVYEHEIVNLAF